MSVMSISPGHDAGDSSEGDSADGEYWLGVQSWQLGSGASGAAARDTSQTLMQTLNAEIIPRLVRSHRPEPVELPHHLPTPLSEADLERFVQACVGSDTDRHLRLFEGFRADGHELPHLYLDLITPAARRIGRLWEKDDCSFPEVTLALYRLQSLLHSLNDEFCANPAYRQPQHRILLAPMPGSHHTLGFYMLAQFFRRDGWNVCSAVEAEGSALVAATKADWYDVVALSASCDSDIGPLRTLVHEIRCASLNPRVGIMVGGPLELDRKVRERLGAEAYSGDALSALRAADRLVHERERPN